MTSYKTFLMVKGTGDTWSKLIDIKNFPDMGAEPEQLENTTLSSHAKTYEPGLENTSSLSFKANYSSADYDTCAALRHTDKDYSIWFGGTEDAARNVTPTGSEGKFDFKGQLDVYVNGAETNAVVDMTITITCSKAPAKVSS